MAEVLPLLVWLQLSNGKTRQMENEKSLHSGIELLPTIVSTLKNAVRFILRVHYGQGSGKSRVGMERK